VGATREEKSLVKEWTSGGVKSDRGGGETGQRGEELPKKQSRFHDGKKGGELMASL